MIIIEHKIKERSKEGTGHYEVLARIVKLIFQRSKTFTIANAVDLVLRPLAEYHAPSRSRAICSISYEHCLHAHEGCLDL